MKIKILLSLFTLSTLVILGVLLQQSSLLQGMFSGGFNRGDVALNTEDANSIVHVYSRANETTSISSSTEVEYTLGVWKVESEEDLSLQGFTFFLDDINSTSSSNPSHVSNFFQNFKLVASQGGETLSSVESDEAGFGYFNFDLTTGETYTITLTAYPLENGMSDLYDSEFNGNEVGMVVQEINKADGTSYHISDADDDYVNAIKTDAASDSGRIEYTWGGYIIRASVYEREEESFMDNLDATNNIEDLLNNDTYYVKDNNYDITNDAPLIGLGDGRGTSPDTGSDNEEEETIADEDGEGAVINNDEEDARVSPFSENEEEEEEADSRFEIDTDEAEEAGEEDESSELGTIERGSDDDEEVIAYEDEEETEAEDRFELDDTVAEEDADDEESSENDVTAEDEEDEEEEDSTDAREKSCDDSFVDTRGHWAEDAICLLYTQNIVEGKDTNYYAPNEYVTKAEFLKMILLNAGYEPDYDLSVTKYKDVNPSDWFYYYVALADSMQDLWFSGESIWSPNSYISRGDAILLTVRISNKTLYGFDESDISFTDVDASSYQAYAIILGEQYGAIEGYTDGTFRPNNKITRAEAAILTIRSSSLFR